MVLISVLDHLPTQMAKFFDKAEPVEALKKVVLDDGYNHFTITLDFGL